MPTRTLISALALLLTFALGWASSAHYNRPRPVATKAQPQQRQADGSLIAARRPAPLPSTQIIPPGDHPTARFQATLAPTRPVAKLSPGATLAATADAPVTAVSRGLIEQCLALLQCPAQTVDGTLATTRKGQLDLVLSSPQGQVQSAVLSPLLPPLVAPAHPWAAGLIFAGDAHYGVFLDRDLGLLRLGVEAEQGRGGNILQARLGWRF